LCHYLAVMNRGRNLFPIQDLAQEDLREVAAAFNALPRKELPAFRASNPLSALGEKALTVFARHPQFSALRTVNEARAMTLGFRTFQDFSALANPQRGIFQRHIDATIQTMYNFRRHLTLGEQLTELRRSYEFRLPNTSRHLGHIARQLEISEERFGEGAGIAYDLEIGARSAAILDT